MNKTVRKVRYSFLAACLAVIIPSVVIAGSVLVPPATVAANSSSTAFTATNGGSGPAILGSSTGGYGVYATSHSASFAALRAANYASAGGAAIIASSVGSALTSDSQIGDGVIGTTKLNSNNSGHFAAGLSGIDFSTIGSSNAGVRGTSTNGIGVSGVTGGDPSAYNGDVNLPGVQGSSFYPDNPGQYGALGLTTLIYGTGFPLQPFAETGFGAYGTGTTGVEGVGRSADLSGVSTTASFGVQGFGQIGVYAESNGGGGQCCPAAVVAVQDTADCGGAPCDVMTAQGPSGEVMSLDVNGNMILSGKLTQSGTPTSIRRGTAGAQVVTYSTQQAVPSLEDFGQGRIVNGEGFVSIAADFASVIDRQANYLVFLTPNADNRGLYVASKSLAGFVVRESQNGRSSLTFDYRIVARPANERGARLPAAKITHVGHAVRSRPFYPAFLKRIRHR